jgi:kinesin family member 1
LNDDVNVHVHSSSVQLRHKDRLLFGANHVYVFLNPLNEIQTSTDIPSIVTWEFAQKEIAKAKGYSLGNNLTIEQEDIQEKILSLLPLLSEINAISEELNKYRVFEIVLMPISSWDGASVKGSK